MICGIHLPKLDKYLQQSFRLQRAESVLCLYLQKPKHQKLLSNEGMVYKHTPECEVLEQQCEKMGTVLLA